MWALLCPEYQQDTFDKLKTSRLYLEQTVLQHIAGFILFRLNKIKHYSCKYSLEIWVTPNYERNRYFNSYEKLEI